MADHDDGRSAVARRTYVDALIAAVPAEEHDRGLVGPLRRLCRALAQDLPAMGAAVNVTSEAGSEGVAAGSDEHGVRIDELRFSLGEGPCRDAFHGRRPVLVSDLQAATLRWPGTARPRRRPESRPRSRSRSVSERPDSVSSTCSRIGRVRYDEQLAVALTFADAATDMLLETAAPDGHLDAGLRTALDYRTEIYQAQGMVMIQLDVSLAEALARVRAHAFATDQDLAQLSRAIVAGDVSLDRDDG